MKIYCITENNDLEIGLKLAGCEGITLQENENVEEKIDNSVKDIEKEALIKIILTGKVDINSERDINYLEKKYKNMFYFAKIYDETILKIDYMKYENDASLKGEFIRLVLKQDLPEEEKRKIITTGIKALTGEEVN